MDGGSKSEAILVVEDDPGVGRLVTRVLTRAGYDVRLVNDGTVALAVIAVADGLFRAVYLDLGLPNVRGEEVLGHLRAHHPALPVLVSSGDLFAEPPDGATAFLPKPFTPFELVDALRQTIAG